MRRPIIRRALTAAALAGTLVLGASWAAAAGSTASPAGHRATRPAAGTFAAADRPRAVSLSADGASIRPTGSALASAARRCAAWAAQAGFPNDGYLAGSLTTAVAIALAESGCDPSACFDNTTKKSCKAPGLAGDSVDRGAWQLNSKSLRTISNKCAYSGPCSARASYYPLSYNPVSDYGSYFALWATYQSNKFTLFIPAAQQAVNTLRSGTVTSGFDGSCLAYPRDKAGSPARLANCGSGAADQQWTVRGPVLRTARGLCLSVSSRSRAATVVLRRCDGRSTQDWLAHVDGSLYDPAARRCLNDPGAVSRPGGVIDDARCSGTQAQAWYKP